MAGLGESKYPIVLDRESCLDGLVEQGYTYQVQKNYGVGGYVYKGELISPDGNLLLEWHFDGGLTVVLRRKDPWLYLMEYRVSSDQDSVYYIHDDRGEESAHHLTDFVNSLDNCEILKTTRYPNEELCSCIENLILTYYLKAYQLSK